MAPWSGRGVYRAAPSGMSAEAEEAQRGMPAATIAAVAAMPVTARRRSEVRATFAPSRKVRWGWERSHRSLRRELIERRPVKSQTGIRRARDADERSMEPGRNDRGSRLSLRHPLPP